MAIIIGQINHIYYVDYLIKIEKTENTSEEDWNYKSVKIAYRKIYYKQRKNMLSGAESELKFKMIQKAL